MEETVFNPSFGGLFIILFGIFTLVLAISNAEWFWGDKKSFNIKKVKGWINLFGRNTTRLFVGIMSVLTILFGIFWLWFH